MSLPTKRNQMVSLFGAAIALLVAFPIAALLGAFFGDTYNTRATVYILVLAWVVIGAILLVLTIGKSGREISKKTFLLWIISVWIWPVLLGIYFQKKK